MPVQREMKTTRYLKPLLLTLGLLTTITTWGATAAFTGKVTAVKKADGRAKDTLVHFTAQPRIPVLIVDGQNNHEWETTTKVLRKALESADRFVVDVATSPRAGASLEGFEPPFHSHRAVVLNYNGAGLPASPFSTETPEGVA